MAVSISGSGAITGMVSADSSDLSTALAAKLDSADYKPGLDFVVRQTFSGVASVSLNNCFTSDYANYCLVLRAVSSSGTPNVRFRLRASSTDNTSANYNYAHLNSDTSVSASQGSNQTAGYLNAISTNDVNAWVADFFGPALASRTIMTGRGNYDNKIIVRNADHNVASAFDGITVYPESGTITGTISVFGYADA